MTPREIAERLAQDPERVCRDLLPNGRREGKEWVCGSTDGEEGKSCKVRLTGPKAGRWADFATGASGDLIDLWCAARGVGMAQALTEAKAQLGIVEPRFEGHRPREFRRPERPKCVVPKDESAVFTYLKGRGLSEETIRAFRIGERSGEIVFPYLRDGELVFAKYLKLDRPNGKKQVRAEADCEPCLFGWQAIPETARSVAITEGEIDAMTLHQFGIHALSVPFGGGKGAKQQWIEYEFPHLQRFDEIYLCLDQDREGQDAVGEIVERLGRHRCRVVSLPHKDANECMAQGAGVKEFAGWFMQAKTLDPDELVNAADYVDAVIEEFYPPNDRPVGMRTPWNKVGLNILFRPGEVSIWTGINGHGKSQLLGHVIADGLHEGETACIASMEMQPQRTLYRMTRQLTGVDTPSIPYIRSAHQWLADKLWLFAVVGTAKSDRILEVFRYARQRYGVTQYIVDSLAKCGIDEDDYRAQKAFVEKLVDFAQEFSVHCHLVAHARKGQDEFTAPGKLDVKGTGAITDMVDNVFTVWRNKRKEADVVMWEQQNPGEPTPKEMNDRSDATLTCSKQRYSGWEGMVTLWFDPKSCQYLAGPHVRPLNYAPVNQEMRREA